MTDVWLRNGRCCRGTRRSLSHAWEDWSVSQAQVCAGHKSWIQVQRNDWISSSCWRAWPSHREPLSWSVPGHRAQWHHEPPFQLPGAMCLDVLVQTWNNICRRLNNLCYSEEETRQPKSPPALTVYDNLLFDFFPVRLWDTSKQGRRNEAMLGRALMLTCFATAIPCKLMKAPLGTSGYMAGGMLLHRVIQLYLSTPSPWLGCLPTPWQQACSRWVPEEMGFLPGAQFAGLFSKEADSMHPPLSSGRQKLILEGSPDSP